MNLNLGCGNQRFENAINLDLTKNTMTDIDIQGNGIRLPFKEESFDKVFAFHVVEHMERKYIDLFLKGCWRVLKEDGKLVVAAPEAIEVLKRFLNNQFGRRWDWYHAIIFGRNLYDSDKHRCLIEEVDFRGRLMNAGFKDLKVAKSGIDSAYYATKGDQLPRYI